MAVQLSLSVVLTTLAMTSCDIDVTITNHWNGGFQAKPCFDITEELTHWQVQFTFSEPIQMLEVSQ